MIVRWCWMVQNLRVVASERLLEGVGVLESVNKSWRKMLRSGGLCSS